MLYVFIGSCQLIIYGLGWIVSNIMFKGSNVIPTVILCVGLVGGVISMFVLGWIS